MNEEIINLKSALNLTMNPLVDSISRSQAFKFIENLRSTSENCAQIGMVLAHKKNDQISRHFGLQLLEDCVKFRWNKMTINEKQFIKENVLELIKSGTHDIIAEETHIKDGLSRIVVEMAKREWPQQWVSMVSEFYQLASVGAVQEEIVLLSLLRLAEDSYILHKLPSSRRRDILLGFSSVMNELTLFFNDVFKKYMQIFADVKTTEAQENKPSLASSIKLIQRCCDVITVFADVIQINSLTPSIIPLLIEALHHPSIRLLAADSLLEIVSKKCGKIEERLALLEHFMSTSTLQSLQMLASSSASDISDEGKSSFFKKLCQIVVTSGTQLCYLLKGGVAPPPIDLNFFITILLSFSTHPHQVISSYCLPLWLNLLKHDVIINQPITEQCCMSILRVSLVLLDKESPQAKEMGKVEFEDLDEFNSFFTRYRVEYGEVLRVISLRNQLDSLEFIGKQLYDLLNINEEATPELYQRWELVVMVFEYMLGKWDFMNINELAIVQSALSLFNSLLLYQCEDPTIGSSHLTCISVLLPLLNLQHDLFPVVINKLISYISFEDAPNTAAPTNGCVRYKAVMNLRRHGCSAFIRFAKMFSPVLCKDFDGMQKQVLNLISRGLSQGEKVACYEALIITSNHLPDDQQSAFLNDVMSSVSQYWLSQDATCTFSSVDKFMDYIGLLIQPEEGVANDEWGINRSQINFCLLMMLAVLRRCTTKHSNIIQPLIHNVFCLIRTYHDIFSAQVFPKVHPSYIPAFDLPRADKARFLGASKQAEGRGGERNAVERMKQFLSGLAEMAYSILGQCCMDASLYRMQQLPHYILNYNFHNVFSLSHLTIKFNLHHFYRHFTKNCPPASYTTIINVVSTLSPFFFHFLNTLWQGLNIRESRRLDPDLHGDVTQGDSKGEAEELIEDQLLVEVTKEYLDCITNLLKEKKQQPTTTNTNNVISESSMDADEDGGGGDHKKIEENISELGQLVLCQENTQIENILFACLTWSDTTVCLKVLPLILPTLQCLYKKGKLNKDSAEEYYEAMLGCLNVHGQHEVVLFVLINVLLQAYELLRHDFPGIVTLIINVAGVSQRELEEFDKKLSQKGTKGFEKKKRDIFRGFLQGAIRKSVSERHKNPVHIKNLTPFKLFKERQEKIWEDFGLCSLFQKEEEV